GIKSREDLGEFYREFAMKANYLQREGGVVVQEVARIFVRVFTGRLKERLVQRLELKEPDPPTGEMYSVEKVRGHAEHILAGLVFEEVTGSTDATVPSGVTPRVALGLKVANKGSSPKFSL